MELTKDDYSALEAAQLIFRKATKHSCTKYIRKLYELGELRTSTKVNGYWWISREDILRIAPRVRSGEIIISINGNC